jgi:hypothetical protein
MGAFHTNEFLPQISSHRCYILAARIDLTKIMPNEADVDIRVSSESKYSFFKQMVIQHIVENGCSRNQRKLNFFPGFVKSEFDLLQLAESWDASSVFAVSLLQAGLKVFINDFFMTYSKSGASKWKFF